MALEGTAREVERIPLASGAVARSVRQDVLKISRAKGQAMRQLEMLVIQPKSFTLIELVEQLKDDLLILVKGRWYDLPEAARPELEISRWRSAVPLGIGATLIAGVIAIGILANGNRVFYAVAVTLLSLTEAILHSPGARAAILERFARAGADPTP